MSETQHRVLPDDNSSQFQETVQKIRTNAIELSTDAWYSLTNYVQSSPENKWIVLAGLAISAIIVFSLIRRLRCF